MFIPLSFQYPDWLHETQVCVNDGLDPEFMLLIQRDNYLYRSKEECCTEHFWWRITQCMANEHPMWFKNGETCDQKVEFEDWESRFTPTDWGTSDMFETLEDCCIAKFWYDIDGCLDNSPREITFTFTIDISEFNDPSHCQDADVSTDYRMRVCVVLYCLHVHSIFHCFLIEDYW